MIQLFITQSGVKLGNFSCLCLNLKYKKQIKKAFRQIIPSPFYILKWNKLSPSQFDKYLDSIKLFFKEEGMRVFFYKGSINNDREYINCLCKILLNISKIYPGETFQIFFKTNNTEQYNLLYHLKKFCVSRKINYKSILNIKEKESRFIQLSGMFSGYLTYLDSDLLAQNSDKPGKAKVVKYILCADKTNKIDYFE